MKVIRIILTSVLVIVSIIVVITLTNTSEKQISSSYHTSKNCVVIDPGHGGKDAGAIGIDGSNEKDINLEISKNLYDYLMVCGINSVMTRDSDYQTYFVEEQRTRQDILNRMKIVNETENSVLISIHQNHFDNEKECGTQIWYSANNEKSKVIADSILQNVKDYLQPNNKRSNKESDDSYYLLYKAKSPSVMIECGFISNIEENKKLQDSDYQNDFAYTVLLGICNIV